MVDWLVDEAIQVGPRTLRGRVYLPAHQPGLAEGGRVGDRYVAYHRARARAGVAMQVTGATPIAPSAEWGDICLWNLDESCVPGYQRLAAAVHDEGGLMLAQLAHPGPTEYEGADVIGASRDFSEVSQQVAVPATREQLADIVRLYAEAADRCRRGDLDGVEISMAHGLLLASFLSPLTNHRDDEFGGSLQGRLRFPLQVLGAVRQAIGGDLILGVRLGADDLTPGGLTVDGAVEMAKLVAPHCDYLSVMVGNNNRLEARVRHWPPTPAPPGLFRGVARAIKQVVDVPVCAVGRITTVELANDLLVAGDADLVGIVRGHIADPQLLPNARASRSEQSRPCVGANVCVNGLLAGRPLTCLVNPDVGVPVPIGASGRVVVVGAGPAGLEAARRAALAGCEVVLLEREDRVGGQVLGWAQAPSRREFVAYLRWCERELARLGVDVRLGVQADALSVQSLAPSLVVLASGSVPVPIPLTEDDGSVLRREVDRALSGPVAATRVVVADDCGFLDAALVAEKIAADGADVTLVTARLHVGEGEGITTLYPLLRTLAEAGVRTLAQQRLVGVRDGNALFAGTFGAPGHILPADLLVSWAGGSPRLDLHEALVAAGLDVRLIGDARRPRRMSDAIADAADAVRTPATGDAAPSSV